MSVPREFTPLAHGGGLDAPDAAALLRPSPESWLALAVLAAAALYLYAVYLLRSRGDHWPVGRAVAFCGLGLGSITLVTLTGVGAYDTAAGVGGVEAGAGDRALVRGAFAGGADDVAGRAGAAGDGVALRLDRGPHGLMHVRHFC